MNDASKIFVKGTQSVAIEYTSHTACTAPTNVYASPTPVTAGTGSKLYWSGAEGGIANPVSKYEVHVSESPGSGYTKLGETTSSSYDITAHATKGSSYYYKIKSIGTVSGADSDLSSVYGTLTAIGDPPTPPSGLTLSSNDVAPGAQVNLSWNASSNPSSNPLVSYQVQVSSDGITFSNLGPTQTERTKAVTANSSAGSSYHYRVVANGLYTTGEPSSSIQLRTTVGTLAAPGNVKVNNATSSTLSPGSVTNLTWDAVSDATNNTVSGYLV